jgi:hypothetical protein
MPSTCAFGSPSVASACEMSWLGRRVQRRAFGSAGSPCARGWKRGKPVSASWATSRIAPVRPQPVTVQSPRGCFRRAGGGPAARGQFLADHLLGDLAIGGFRQLVPEARRARQLVARDLVASQSSRSCGSGCAWGRHADGHADLAPDRIGTPRTATSDRSGCRSASPRSRADRCSSRPRCTCPTPARSGRRSPRRPYGRDRRSEPAVAEAFGVGLGVVEIAGEDGGADHAISPVWPAAPRAILVLDLHLHPGAGEAAGADAASSRPRHDARPGAAR